MKIGGPVPSLVLGVLDKYDVNYELVNIKDDPTGVETAQYDSWTVTGHLTNGS
jgi:hypothetical protein